MYVYIDLVNQYLISFSFCLLCKKGVYINQACLKLMYLVSFVHFLICYNKMHVL